MLDSQPGITQSWHNYLYMKASILHLLALAISRRHSPFLIDTSKIHEQTTTLAAQLASAIPDTLNSSLVDTLACSIIQTRSALLIRTWDSHTATKRLLSIFSHSALRTSNSRPNQPLSTPIRMPEWEQPPQRLPKCSEPSATGRDLGVINRKYFETATWDPLLSTEMGRGQYGKFVTSMIERIRAKESNFDEIRSFVHLVATEHNWDFMRVAMPYLPELKEQ